MILNDPIVEEMRVHGMAFTARHGNDIGRMCAAVVNKQAIIVKTVMIDWKRGTYLSGTETEQDGLGV
uniref:Uncharacterized protein n=1 Tax=Candidatus Kentrum sp. FW TaxID=2126338 RepID=A0A450TVZ6_9GAMM|nr:MAG: hypothetical protein BECKFW1821C_GA0114237_104617 [Candidatus Kentron sp. FW]